MAWLLVFERDAIALHFANCFLVSKLNVRRSEVTSAVVLLDIKC